VNNPPPALPSRALTTEQPVFNRQTGLQSGLPSLSLRDWDVDPDVVAQRLTVRAPEMRATTEWGQQDDA